MPYIGTSPSNGVRRVHTYTATASQTTFTGASSEGVTLSYADTNYIDVFQNGVLLGSADYTSTSGTSVVLAQGASADDLIVIVVYDVFSVADTVSKTNGGSFDSAVTMSNNLTVSGAFTSQGIDDNADATAITIDSSENVGIGTSPNAKLDIKDDSNSTQFILRGRSSDNFGILDFRNNAGDTVKGQVKSDASSNLILRAGSTNDALKIDTNGHVTMPLQSAFSVHKNVSTQSNISNSGDQLVTFSTERFDVNSDFDTSTSKFTAPVTGKYFLSVSCRFAQFDIDADYIILFIATSNQQYRVLIDPNFSADLNFFTMTSTVLADMDAGDTAEVGYSQSGGLPQVDIVGNTDYTYFTGYLVA